MANEAKPCPCDIGDRMEYGALGQEVQMEHFKAYVVKPSTASDKAIVVIQDIFGWQLPNTRYMADMLAANGYIRALTSPHTPTTFSQLFSQSPGSEQQTARAICPDFFVGKEPWSPTKDWSNFQEWLQDKKPTAINKEVDAVLKFLKNQCGAKHIGVVGFCWGGVATHYLALLYPEIKAGVSVYGIVREREDRYELKSPTLFVFAENDSVIPLDQVSALEANLKEKCKVDYQVKIFPGQTHGFVHRKREDINPADKPYIQEARKDLLNWLNTYM
ncbi:carboxymethylenebutenolidase homolog isoform X1 [Astatotilapia calliptera]|nr:carboxymethylenebutenolidase homolog isoform X1 [Astatotilapia calliptera]XP_026035211.1 carboxymethylenebutenolidase homolog isoform X1 [Astatotilapia calliptera]